MGDWDDNWGDADSWSQPAAPIQSYPSANGDTYSPSNYQSPPRRGRARSGFMQRNDFDDRNGDGQMNWRDNDSFGGRQNRNDFGQDRQGNGGGRGGGGFQQRFDGEEKVTIEVAPEDVGRIIGRGGSKIKELESESGARIKVSRSTPPEVQLFGTAEQCQAAKSLIEDLTSGGYRGGGGGYRGGGGGFRGGRGGDRFDRDRNDRGFGRDRDFGGGRSQNRGYGENGGVGHWRQPPADDLNSDNTWRPGDSKVIENQDGTSTTIVYTDREEATGESFEDVFARLRRAALSDELGPEWENEPPLIKNFYNEDPAVAAMTDEAREEFYRQQNNIMVNELKPSDMKIPNPVRTFEEAWQDHGEIMQEILKQGFERPSPIQCQAWPTLLSGRDFIGIAQTGSGKTLAFLLPAFIHIEGQTKPRSERQGPTVLIMAPTRELALQIKSEVDKYSYRGIRCLCVYGGASRREQINAVRESMLEIVVATPGRLNDLVQADQLSLHDVSYVVLDEADRMLDMGFEPQVVKTLYQVRKDRQTVMTSATWPSGVRRIANEYMRNPIQCVVGTLDLNACHDVTQFVEFVEDSEKKERLFRFISEMGEDDKAIIFLGRKLVVDDLVSDLILAGHTVDAMHGGKDQSDRENTLIDFREGRSRLLVATDLASRGLDITDVTHVFNYDFPRNVEEYVHRVGRTGRAGRSGTAISLITRDDWRNAGELIKILEEGNQEVPEELRRMAERFARRQAEGPRRGGFRGGGRGGGGRGRGGGGFRSNFFM